MRIRAAWAGLAWLAIGATASAQPRRPAEPVPTVRTRPGNVRAHVGTDQASWLLGDNDERIRGIERASAIGSPEAIALMVEAVERNPAVKNDARAYLALARGLARFADQDRARTGLLAIVGAGNPNGARPVTKSADGIPVEEGDPVARMHLARETAAIALAKSGGDRALEALYAAARGSGVGRDASIVALSLYPPREPGFYGTGNLTLTVPVIKMLGRLGDLRALDVLTSAAKANDVNVRAAALVALAELGDERTIALARSAIAETDVRLRAAAGEVFILLTAPERFKATQAIVADDATIAIGLKLAERVYSPEITKLVSDRANTHPDRGIRVAAIRALGRSPDSGAAKALTAPQLLGDNELSYLAIAALARSPAPNASALIGGLLPTRLVSYAVRAYVVRALVRGERLSSSDEAIFKLASSANAAERALGVFARIALGDAELEKYIDDKEPRVRRAAAMASLALPESADRNRILIRRLVHEEDPVTRQVLSIGLAGGDPNQTVPTSLLVDRAESGGGDAALATFALARRSSETQLGRKVSQLLASKDAVLRAHAARGLAEATLPDATGRLADLYTWETDETVRRAAIGALAARTQDEAAPARKAALAIASELDPDGIVRQTAKRAIAPAATRECAWLRLTLDSGAPPGEAFVGSVVRADGLAVPIVFDEEGFAVIPGLPPGEARLVLSPRLPK